MAGQFGFMRNAIRNLIPMLREAFTSANSALKFVREEGLKIRTSTFYDDWSETVSAESARQSLSYVRPDHTPREGSISKTKLQIQRKYQVVGEISLFNEDMGTYEKRHISYLTDTIKTKDEMRGVLEDAANMGLEHYGATVVESVSIVEIKRSVYHGS